MLNKHERLTLIILTGITFGVCAKFYGDYRISQLIEVEKKQLEDREKQGELINKAMKKLEDDTASLRNANVCVNNLNAPGCGGVAVSRDPSRAEILIQNSRLPR
jgi:hypothetical protein